MNTVKILSLSIVFSSLMNVSAFSMEKQDTDANQQNHSIQHSHDEQDCDCNNKQKKEMEKDIMDERNGNQDIHRHKKDEMRKHPEMAMIEKERMKDSGIERREELRENRRHERRMHRHAN